MENTIGILMALLGTYFVGRLLWKITYPLDAFAAMVFTMGGISGSWMLAAQLLSPFRGILPLPFGLTVLVIGLILKIWCRNIKSFQIDSEYSFKTYAREAITSRTNTIILFGIVAVAMTTTIAGYLAHPWGDNYHFSRPAYWVQNQSLLPFHTHNFRIACFAPGGDIHHLPFYLFFAYQKSNVLIGFLCALLIPGVIWSLSKRSGVRAENAWILSAISISLTPILSSIFSGGTHILLPALLATVSFIYILAARKSESKDKIKFLALSLFCFALGSGMKNPVILMVPGYLVALIVLIPYRYFLNFKRIRFLVTSGLLGIIISGALWNYVSNYCFYGNIKGSDLAIKESTAKVDIQEVYTRVVRGASYIIDTTVSLGHTKKINNSIYNLVENAPGIKSELDGEKKNTFWSYPHTGPPARGGLGLIGPFFMIAFLINTWQIFRGSKNAYTSEEDKVKMLMISALILYIFIGFILLHGVVRWSTIGRFRLSHALILPAMPIVGVLLTKKWTRHAALALALINSLLMVGISASLSLRRYGHPMPYPLSIIQSLAPDQTFDIFIKKEKQNEVKHSINEEYNMIGEIYDHIANNILDTPKKIALISNFNSVESWLFGKQLQHKIIPIVRSDKDHISKMLLADYLVIDSLEDTGIQFDQNIKNYFKIKMQFLNNDKTILYLLEKQ